MIDPLRYEADDPGSEPGGDGDGEFAFLRIRYKQPGEDDSRLIEAPVTDLDVRGFDEADREVRFAVAAAGYAQLLRGDPHLNDFGYANVIEIAQDARGEDPFGYRAEFVQLARLAESAAAQAALSTGGRGE